jgi:hypothetical protein
MSLTASNSPDLTRTYTAGELLRFLSDWYYELIAGRLRPMHLPGDGAHGLYSARLCLPVMVFIRDHCLGDGFTANTGFLVARNPDTVKAPNFAHMARARRTGVPPACCGSHRDGVNLRQFLRRERHVQSPGVFFQVGAPLGSGNRHNLFPVR